MESETVTPRVLQSWSLHSCFYLSGSTHLSTTKRHTAVNRYDCVHSNSTLITTLNVESMNRNGFHLTSFSFLAFSILTPAIAPLGPMPIGRKHKGRGKTSHGPPSGPPSKKSMARLKHAQKSAGQMFYRESDDVSVTTWMNKVDSKPKDVSYLEKRRRKPEASSSMVEEEELPAASSYDALLQTFQLSSMEEARKAAKKRKRDSSEAIEGHKEASAPVQKKKLFVASVTHNESDSEEVDINDGQLEDEMDDDMENGVSDDDVAGDDEEESYDDLPSGDEEDRHDRRKHEERVLQIRKILEGEEEEAIDDEDEKEGGVEVEVLHLGSDVYDKHFGREFSKQELEDMDAVPMRWLEMESQRQFEANVWRDSHTPASLHHVASSAQFKIHPKVAYSWKHMYGEILQDSLKPTVECPDVPMTPTQQHLFSLLNSYSDVLYCLRNPLNGLEIMSTYALHVANHITKSLERQRSNNYQIHDLAAKKRKIKAEITMLKKTLEKKKVPTSGQPQSESTPAVATTAKPVLPNIGIGEESVEAPVDITTLPRAERIARMKELHSQLREDEVEFRDQGFTKPKVLVLLPMKNAALEFVELLLKAMPRGMVSVVENRRKFYGDYFEEVYTSRARRPLEWLSTFRGNTDDTFRLGIAFKKNKTAKLYSGFYKSDVIVASPLGLRLAVDEKEQGAFDYLSSVDMVIMDQGDVMLMQNWEHVLWVFERLSQLPQKTREEIDFSRVRHYFLDRQAKLYRQTIIFSSVLNVDLNSLFNRQCQNTFGRYKIRPRNIEGTVSQVITSSSMALRQVFYRLNATSIESSDDARFDYFTKQVWEHLSGSSMEGTLIMVPSYFDYLRLHKFFRGIVQHDEFNAVAVSEYTNETRAIKYRKHFYTGRAQIMLMTERYHFYKRIRIRGIKSLIWYSPPLFPTFYSEIGNWIEEGGSILTLYTKYDILNLEGVVGRERCDVMVSSERTTHSISS